MAYWCARFELRREAVGQRFLELAGYTVYIPKLRELRKRGDRRAETIMPLFPSYGFVEARPQWHAARWCIGVVALIMDGQRPATLGDDAVAAIRAREVRGAVELPKSGMRLGTKVRVTAGPFVGHLGLFAGQRPHERILVLLALFGSQRQIELGRGHIEAAS